MNVRADVDALSSLVPGAGVRSDHVEMTGPDRVAASAFDVDRLLAASATYCVSSADAVVGATPHRSIDLGHLLAFCTTHVEVDGQPVPAWADLSGVYPTADGRHLQIHCNFAHHADGVVRHLGCDPDPSSVATAIGERDAFDLEDELVADGMIAAAVRTLEEWDAHPHAVATRDLPPLSVTRIGAAGTGHASTAGGSTVGGATVGGASSDSERDDPLSGVRVLDCSRVLAGPVAGQMLAGFGADVLRAGADHLPSVPVGVMSTGFGKRNTSVDLRTERGAREMSALLGQTDVWIDAYRPGAMAGHGFTPERAAELRPGIVVVQICAFDWVGPWAGRRGFDSIVQSTTGIRAAGGACGVGVSEPLGLPVQALDYATGFLAAGVAAQLLRHRRDVGGSWLARVSLLRTRNWMASFGGPVEFTPAAVGVDRWLLDSVDSNFGRLTAVRPFAGRWPSPPRRLGTSAPAWNRG